MTLAHKKCCYLVCLVLLYNTFPGMMMICLTAKYVICQFSWSPIHYVDCVITLKVIESSVSMIENMNLIGPLSFLCDLAFWIVGRVFHYCLLNTRIVFWFYVITVEKWDISSLILKFIWTGSPPYTVKSLFDDSCVLD